MKTATVRDLRHNFSRLAKWIEEGETVDITRSGKPFARLTPIPPVISELGAMPDFLQRLHEEFPGESPSTENEPLMSYARGDR